MISLVVYLLGQYQIELNSNSKPFALKYDARRQGKKIKTKREHVLCMLSLQAAN